MSTTTFSAIAALFVAFFIGDWYLRWVRRSRLAAGRLDNAGYRLAGWTACSRIVERLVIAIALLVCIGALFPSPAQASIHTYPEPERQTTMYRSRLSLRDDQDLAWQTILYKRIQDHQVTEVNLRLISFPGQLNLSHPHALQVEQNNHNLTLVDETLLDPQLQTVQSSLAQYDARPLLLALDRPASLENDGVDDG